MCLDTKKLRRYADQLVKTAQEMYAYCDEVDGGTGVPVQKVRATDWWCEKYKEKFGREYIITDYAKCGNILKLLRQKLGDDLLKEICIRYFNSDDPWVKEQAYSLEALPSMVNKLIAQKSSTQSPAQLLALKYRDHKR